MEECESNGAIPILQYKTVHLKKKVLCHIIVVYCKVHLAETSERAGGTIALEDTIQSLRRGDSEVLYFSGGCHDMISVDNFFMHTNSGDRASATLHFTKITVQDDHEKGHYRCIGYSATGRHPDSQRFDVRVTASELEILCN